MSSALVLLTLAIQLLTVVANTPNLPQSYRDAAITIGNTAVQEANLEIAKENQATTTQISAPIITDTQSTVPTQTPLFGAILTTMPADQSAITVTQIQGDPKDAQLSPFGTFVFNVSVLNSEGQKEKDAPILITVDGLTNSLKTNTQTSLHSADWYGTYVYTPQIAGDKTITFASGNLTKEIPVTVQ